MTINELYESVFHDGKEFSDYMIEGRGSIPVTIEDESGVAAMCLISPRAMNANAAKLYGYRSAQAAYVSGVCVREDLRGRGLGKELLEKMKHVCRDLGFFAIYVSPAFGKEGFYKKAGFETVDQGKNIVIHKNMVPHFFAKRMTDSSEDRALATSFIANCTKKQASFCYGVHDVERLIREADMMDGLYSIYDGYAMVGLAVKDDDTLPWTLLLQREHSEFILSSSVADGQFVFLGCSALVPCVGKEAFMMRCQLKPTKQNARDLPTGLFERF